MHKKLADFRCSFLKYLNNPSKTNQNSLYNVSLELSNYATELAMKEHKSPQADEVGEKLQALVGQALTNISISSLKSQNLDEFLNSVMEKDKQLGNSGPSSALTAAWDLLKERLVTNEQYQVLNSIYAIELDGHRIINIDQLPGMAALTLSGELLQITHNVFKKGKCESQDTNDYISAYDAVKGQGIERHRGLKEKFHNFLTVLSCFFVIPLFYRAYNAHQVNGSFWTPTKTKTLEDIEKSAKEIENYTRSQLH